jgi:hypothetical protein
MFQKLSTHMKGDKRSVAEEFHLTHEAKFPGPTLEQMYWRNPNAERGEIARCIHDAGGIRAEVHHSEGN